MSMWILLLIIFGAGAIGGVVNALMTDNAFIIPEAELASGKADGPKIWRPGIIGNIITSGIAACVSWGLYGPFSATYIVGGGQTTQAATSDQPGITLAAFVGAILVGIAGARWLTNEVDKTLLRATATEAATSNPSSTLSRQIAILKPLEALRFVKTFKE